MTDQMSEDETLSEISLEGELGEEGLEGELMLDPEISLEGELGEEGLEGELPCQGCEEMNESAVLNADPLSENTMKTPLIPSLKCLPNLAKARKVLCTYYQHMSNYYRCMFNITRKKEYLVNYRQMKQTYYKLCLD